ncbi:hypothetical protein [Actinoplanes subtropicus]|uniref:hypothetical protein n=1 Tax=Actinoplanes subtropicus TaxID=543632 RepID=UPI0004C431B4|nr:hypothetical protein [Actinoplanes subtropicus]
MADDFQYHIDQHGSLVRPAELRSARASGNAVSSAAAERDAAVATAHEQRRLTLSAVGDGQFRREHFESVVHDHVDGFEDAAPEHPIADLVGIAPARRRAVRGPLAAEGRLAEHEEEPLLRTVDRPVFGTLPSPGYLALLSDPSAGPGTVEPVGEELAAILRAEIAALAAQGVAYVTLGNPLLVPLLTADGRARVAEAGAVLEAVIAADRSAVTGLGAPPDFRVGLDLTDHGPFATTESGYDPGALDRLVGGTRSTGCASTSRPARPGGCRSTTSRPASRSASASSTSRCPPPSRWTTCWRSPTRSRTAAASTWRSPRTPVSPPRPARR